MRRPRGPLERARHLRASLALRLHVTPSQIDGECWQDLLDVVAVATNEAEDMEAERAKRPGAGPRVKTTKKKYVQRKR